jgi:ankyrin repeat protein
MAAAVVILAVTTILWTGSRFFRLFSAFSGLLEAELRHAACKGNTRRVKQLLRLGVNVNATGDQGSSALIEVESCKGDNDPSRVELVELLITNGAAVNLRNDEGRTALMYTARNGDTPVVNALLRSGASVNIADNGGETAIMRAAATSCSEETVRALVSAGADLNARDHKGRNALDSFRSSYACPESKVGDLLQIRGPGKGK